VFVIAWKLDLQLPMQSEYIPSNVVSSNPTQAIQNHVIKFVSDLRNIGDFFSGTPVSSANKTDRHDIAELLLKVSLNTISLAY
jgi:hypothetical protein